MSAGQAAVYSLARPDFLKINATLGDLQLAIARLAPNNLGVPAPQRVALHACHRQRRVGGRPHPRPLRSGGRRGAIVWTKNCAWSDYGWRSGSYNSARAQSESEPPRRNWPRPTILKRSSDWQTRPSGRRSPERFWKRMPREVTSLIWSPPTAVSACASWLTCPTWRSIWKSKNATSRSSPSVRCVVCGSWPTPNGHTKGMSIECRPSTTAPRERFRSVCRFGSPLWKKGSCCNWRWGRSSLSSGASHITAERRFGSSPGRWCCQDNVWLNLALMRHHKVELVEGWVGRLKGDSPRRPQLASRGTNGWQCQDWPKRSFALLVVNFRCSFSVQQGQMR